MMEANGYWSLFIQTGQPVFYLLYQEALAAEAIAPKTA